MSAEISEPELDEGAPGGSEGGGSYIVRWQDVARTSAMHADSPMEASLMQQQILPQGCCAPSFVQPRPIGLSGRAGRPYTAALLSTSGGSSEGAGPPA